MALFAFRMPVDAALATAGYGAAYGLFPIGWIILNLIFLYQLTVDKGLFAVLRGSLANLAPDPRVQLVLIAFSFGAFFEGAAGFGTPVAVTAAILMQLGFKPLQAAGLSLIANTAPVAYGALGTPIIALAGVTGLDLHALSAMAGRQLPFFSLVVPFWVVWVFAGFQGTMAVWPAILLAGVAGLLAGSFSMAAGEYISMQSQRELFERQIHLEREELKAMPEEEESELAAIETLQ